jgi:hypothetical protein
MPVLVADAASLEIGGSAFTRVGARFVAGAAFTAIFFACFVVLAA